MKLKVSLISFLGHLIVIVLCLHWSALWGGVIQFPLRVIQAGSSVQELRKNQIEIRVNGGKVAPLAIIKQSRTLDQKDMLGRNLVLSVYGMDYTPALEKGLSYFVAELLYPHDSLWLVTPEKIYQLNNSRNKVKLSNDIRKLLKKDTRIFRKKLKTIEKALSRKLTMVKVALDDRTISGGFGVRRIFAIVEFLNTFPLEFKQYRELLIPLRSEKINFVGEKFGFREGERWWIHFHQEESQSFLSRLRTILRRLEIYVTEIEKRQQRKLSELKKLLVFSNLIPVDRIARALINHEITLNILHHGDLKNQANEGGDMGLALQKTAMAGGGIHVKTLNLVNGLDSQLKHPSQFYRIIIPWVPTDAHIEITSSKENWTFHYPKILSKKRNSKYNHFVEEGKVKLEKVSFRQKLHFSLRNFEYNKKEGFGLLEVRISILSPQGDIRFSTQKTLRTSKDKVTVSIPLPKEFVGKHQVRIRVVDHLANTQDINTQWFDLN